MTLGIVLAAGRGRRAGGPKALLELGGTTALQLCLRALAGGGADELRVVLGPDAEAVRAAVPLAGAEVLVNEHAERGQTSSLQLALSRGTGRGECFLLHPVDHPLARAEDVAALLAAFAGRRPHERLVLPAVGGRRGHPALFARELAPEFLALGADEPAHAVARRDPARVLLVPRENPWLVRDIDTPEDLRAAREALAEADQ